MVPKPRDRRSKGSHTAAPPSLVVNRLEPSTTNAITSQQHVFAVDGYSAYRPPYDDDSAKKTPRMSRDVTNRKVDRPLICPECPGRKAYKTATTLREHINRVHTKEKVYLCSRKGCTKVYGDAAGKSRCEKSHQGRYLCLHRNISGCSFKSKRSDGIRRHMANRHHHHHYIRLRDIEFHEFENSQSSSSPTIASTHSIITPMLPVVEPETHVNLDIEDPAGQLLLDVILGYQLGSYLLLDYGYTLPFSGDVFDSIDRSAYSLIPF